MGSQLSRQGSQGHGSSGIQQNGSATSVLSDVVIESDPNSQISSGTQTPTNQVRITFKWTHGGNEVFLIGSFNNWRERIRMEKKDNEFVYVKLLQRDQNYEYKFIVDNEWRFSPDQQTKKDVHGNVNNYVNSNDVIKKPLDMKRFRKYTQSECFNFSLEPDPIPLHLNYSIANHSNTYDYRQKDTVPAFSNIRLTNGELSDENKLRPSELPNPSHVILNHVAVREEKGVVGLSLTGRYKNKYVTLLYYKPSS